MQDFILRINFSTRLLLGSALALGLSAAACSSSNNTPGGGSGGSDSGASGGAHSTGGSKASGGSGGNGGTGGSSGSGGAKGGAGGKVATDGGPDGCVPETLTMPSGISNFVQTPAGVTLIHHFHGIGTQDYTCTGAPTVGDAGMTTYSWVFTGPEAVLSNNCGRPVGTHFSGPTGPEWQLTSDMSIVEGSRIKFSHVVGSIDELLLVATNHTGAGDFADVTYIQRLRTTGGVSPGVADCGPSNLNEVRKVPYTADYYFYTGAIDAGP
jgi:hypothetical protein